jgi:hypothetical protein
MIAVIFSFFTAWNSAHLFAAPIPFTSSSKLTSEKAGIYRSPLGFTIDAADTGWVAISPAQKNDFVVTTYESPSKDAALTVRVDELKAPLSLDEYSKKWIKDYPRFGFDVLAAKKVKVGEEIAYLIDFVSAENKKQLRQVLFLKNKHAITLTCRGSQTQFKNSVRACNDIVRSMRWL